jgi:hypothetical protein
MSAVSIGIAEYYLSYSLYVYLMEYFAFTDLLASLITAAAFLLQVILLTIFVYVRLNKIQEESWLVHEKNNVEKTFSAFMEGFRNGYKH